MQGHDFYKLTIAPKKYHLAKPLKHILKAVKILLALILFAGISALVYVSLNKKKIIRAITAEMENKINGEVGIGNVELSFFRNFPHISVLFKDMIINDTMHQAHGHTFFKAKEVFARIHIFRLMRNEPPVKGIRVVNGELYLYTDTTGYTNTYLFRSQKTGSSNSNSSNKISVKTILLKQVHIVINDLQKRKLHEFSVADLKMGLDDRNGLVRTAVKADILVKCLAFNTARGSYIQNKNFRGKFDLLYNMQLKQLSFDSININISGQPFNLSGKLDMAGTHPQFNLRIHTRGIAYDFIRTSLPAPTAKALSIVEIDKPLDADAVIAGALKGGDPKVDVHFRGKNAALKTIFFDFEEAGFTGYYTNEVVAGLPRKDPNSTIVLQDFAASWHGLPVHSRKIEILDLSKPLLSCDLVSDLPLTKLNRLMGSRSLQFKQGSATMRLTYSGPLARNDKTNAYINGVIAFKDAAILYTSRNVELTKLAGRLVFKNSDAYAEHIRCKVLGNDITMEGQVKNLLTLINTEPDKANIDWNIYTPTLRLDAFLFLLRSREKHSGEKNDKPVLNNIANKIDDLLDRGRLQVKLKADKLKYKNFEATNTLADITMLNDRYIINKVIMNHSGGFMELKGALLNRRNFHQANLRVRMDNVDVNRVFADFNNFGQDGITAESLEGKLYADLDADMHIDHEGRIIPASIVSQVDFLLRDGALINYEPVKKLQRFVFKKRDFDNIRFAELKNRLEIGNQEIKINRMEIQSTVMSMFVEGIYNQKGSTDISIQVPLSNLKKRNANYNPENIGVDKKGGSSLFIRGRPGEDGRIRFKLDLFKKFAREKKANGKS